MSYRALIVASIVLLSLVPGVMGAPGVQILSVPSAGSSQYWISGVATDAAPAEHAVVAYVRVGSAWWGPKPTFADPLTSIRPDGFWDTTFVTGGYDDQATDFAVYLLPRSVVQAGVVPPELHGASSLPSSLEVYPHAVASRPTTTPLPVPTVRREGTDLVGLNFGPYLNGENPGWTVLSESTIVQRMQVVAPYTTWFRTFGVDRGLERVGPLAHSMGKKAAVGAWLSHDLAANRAQLEALVQVGRAGGADILIVGSETLERGNLTERELVTYLQWVREQVPGVPVATADTYGQFLAHRAVVEASDLLLVNIYPYWEGVSIENAVSRTRAAYLQVTAVAGGRPVIVSEMGWPDAGPTKGQAVPSAANAARFLREATDWAHAESVPYFYFEAFDEVWKASSGEGEVGAHWGIWDGNLGMKPGRLPLEPVVMVPGGTAPPTDTDADARCDDVNGNGRADFADVVLYFNQMSWIAANEPVASFDYNGNGRIDFADVVWLFNRI